jgi:nucleotide-binding universal stress UspA family protein
VRVARLLQEAEQGQGEEAARQLALLAEDLGRKSVTVTTQVGTANEVGQEILLIAEHVHADLIGISTHGMTGWHRLAFGSVAEKVVRLATCPVLVLRAQLAAEGH